MAATTLLSPPQQQQQQPLGESDIANRMDVDPEGETKKKRKSDANLTGSSKKHKKRESVSGKHCHQCHQTKDVYLGCTVLTTRGKKTERCGKVFCQECLRRRYDEDVPTIISAGRPKDLNKLLGHAQTESYVWRCPICSKNCNCAPHRKQYGLPPAGLIASLAKENGLTVAQLLQDPSAMEAARLAKEATPKKPKPPAATATAAQDPKSTGKEGTSEQKEKKTKKKQPADKTTDKAKERVAKKAVAKTLTGSEKVAAEKLPGSSTDKLKEKGAKPAAAKVGKPIMAHAIAPAPIKPFIRQPKYVEDPEFEFIGISYPLAVIEKRLQVREFVLRFEKKMIKLPPKYLRTINDPNSDWTDLTYRNLITNLLPIIQADGNHLIHGDVVYEAIQEIQKTTADNPKIWTILKDLLEEVYPDHLPDDFDSEEARLEAIMLATNLALQATVIRQQIDDDIEKEKDKNKATMLEIKKLKTDWEQTKGELQKERLLLKVGERTDWDDRYARAFKAYKKLIALVEERQWFASRKTCLRTSPLGTDAKGNTYWMFTQRDRKDEDWGQWVVVEKNRDLPHPSGALPKVMDDLSNPADDEPDVPEKKDEDDAAPRIWYAVSGSQNVRKLAEWIKYQTDLVLFAKATAANNKIGDSLPVVAAATPKSKHAPEKASIDTVSRKLLVEVRLPLRTSDPADPADLVAKESTEAFCFQLQRIANFMELGEDPQKLI